VLRYLVVIVKMFGNRDVRYHGGVRGSSTSLVLPPREKEGI